MNRRTFLKSTGVAATAPLLSELVSGATETPDIQHVVLVMMENRSFDHLFGWLPNADGKQAGLEFPYKTGGQNATWELAPDFTGLRLWRPGPQLFRRPPGGEWRQDEWLSQTFIQRPQRHWILPRAGFAVPRGISAQL